MVKRYYIHNVCLHIWFVSATELKDIIIYVESSYAYNINIIVCKLNITIEVTKYLLFFLIHACVHSQRTVHKKKVSQTEHFETSRGELLMRKNSPLQKLN